MDKNDRGSQMLRGAGRVNPTSLLAVTVTPVSWSAFFLGEEPGQRPGRSGCPLQRGGEGSARPLFLPLEGLKEAQGPRPADSGCPPTPGTVAKGGGHPPDVDTHGMSEDPGVWLSQVHVSAPP